MQSQSESQRRSLRTRKQRQPLGDITNKLHSSSTSSRSSSLVRNQNQPTKKSTLSSFLVSNDPVLRNVNKDTLQNPGSTPQRAPESAAAAAPAVTDVGRSEESEPATVYIRRWSAEEKGKAKVVEEPSSPICSPVKRTLDSGEQNAEDSEIGLSKRQRVYQGEPLSDCTNTVQSSSTSSLVFDKTAKKLTFSFSVFKEPVPPPESESHNTNTNKYGVQDPSTSSTYEFSPPLRAPQSSSSAAVVSEVGRSEEFEPATVYTRRRSTENRSKGKAVDQPSSGSSCKREQQASEIGLSALSKRPRLSQGKPLSDCTNTVHSSCTSSVVKRSTKKSTLSSSVFKEPAPLPESNSHNTITNKDSLQDPKSVSAFNYSSPPQSSSSSAAAAGDVGRSEEFEPGTVYTRRRSIENRSKGERVVQPSRGSSQKRLLNIGERKTEDSGTGLSKRRRVSQGKKIGKASSKQDDSKDSLDAFIQQQKAYFEAIDAEKLEEEVE